MRQIKFRGLNEESKQMVFGCLVNNMWTYSELTDRKGQAVCEIMTGEYAGDCWEEAAFEDGCIVTVIPESVGEFTGLKDKNGKEIYEGDILNILRHEDDNNWASKLVHRKDKMEVVTFAGGCFVIEGTGEKLVDYIWSIVHHRIEAEVIGNIHENAGLLAVAP